jgi:hypothetical protein
MISVAANCAMLSLILRANMAQGGWGDWGRDVPRSLGNGAEDKRGSVTEK